MGDKTDDTGNFRSGIDDAIAVPEDREHLTQR
jgi:hypothetical protein